MQHYRAPFLTALRASRTWRGRGNSDRLESPPCRRHRRSLPRCPDPLGVAEAHADRGARRAGSGAIIAWCHANLPNLEIVPVGGEVSLTVQEDNPVAIGRALASWLARI